MQIAEMTLSPSVLVYFALLVVALASPVRVVDPLQVSKHDQHGFDNPCAPFGFDNRIVCLFCSVEDLLPFMSPASSAQPTLTSSASGTC